MTEKTYIYSKKHVFVVKLDDKNHTITSLI